MISYSGFTKSCQLLLVINVLVQFRRSTDLHHKEPGAIFSDQYHIEFPCCVKIDGGLGQMSQFSALNHSLKLNLAQLEEHPLLLSKCLTMMTNDVLTTYINRRFS